MEIVPIFGEKYPKNDGLLTIILENQEYNEFELLFEKWNDVEYLTEICKKNESTIFRGFFKLSNTETFILAVQDEASELERKLLMHVGTGHLSDRVVLESIFEPFYPQQSPGVVLQQSDVRVNAQYTKKPLLRIYALKLSPTCFLITGGAIKLYATTNEGVENTKIVTHMNSVRDHLRSLAVTCQDDLQYYYEEH